MKSILFVLVLRVRGCGYVDDTTFLGIKLYLPHLASLSRSC